MKSSNEILNAFYSYVVAGNISITGRVYQGKAILTEQDENIEINVLNNDHRNYVQRGLINLNLYMKGRADNTPNISRMTELGTEIVTALGKGANGNYKFQIDNESGILEDESQDKMYFINYKFNYQTIS